jgi:hypothetical protein
MNGSRRVNGRRSVLVLLVSLGAARQVAAQEMRIGIVDFFGLSRLSPAEARAALTFKEGDAVVFGEPLAAVAESERRLSALPGVARAQANMVCCDAGRVIVYLGVEEEGARVPRFRKVPGGPARLAADVVRAGADYAVALDAAVRRGDFAEDDSQGHSLAHDPAQRAVEERFILFARRDRERLRAVLRGSSEAGQRALAAQVLGYAADKQAVADDLVRATRDPDADTRNNAMRALLVFGEAVPGPGHPRPRVPYAPFVALLDSPVWTDRNKAAGALSILTSSRDPALLALLRARSLPALAEMARWKSDGHALGAFMILGRLAGATDAEAQAAFDRGARAEAVDAFLGEARARRNPRP